MSVGVSSESKSTETTAAEIAAKRSYPKTHANYWKSRLEHRTYTRDGKTFEVAEWSVRIHFTGIRKSFDLETANKEEAATKARDIYLSILARGWSATVNELAPQLVPLVVMGSDSATVGEFLAEVERTANLKPKTFRYYSQCLRQFAAYVEGVKSDASRFDYRKGGATAWRQQVELTPLSALTPAAAADYKMVRLKRAGSDPRRKLEVNRSFNSWLRNTKSLFTEAIICQPNFRVKVPKFKVPDGQRGEREVYWFEAVDFERPGSMKFQSPAGVTYEALVTQARDELRAENPEAYKLFLLCLCAGLRRGEADVCMWTQLNGDDNSIQIEANKYIEPKHGSGGTVYVDPSLMKELLSFRGPAQDGFVVDSRLEWKATTYRRYRCEPHWETLTEGWRATALTRKKCPRTAETFRRLHCEAKRHFRWERALRHSTIQMAASHYTDPRQRGIAGRKSFFRR